MSNNSSKTEAPTNKKLQEARDKGNVPRTTELSGAFAMGAFFLFFKLFGATWLEQAKLTASDAAAEDWFGFSVSVSGDRVLVGAHHHDDAGSDSGSAYVFELVAGVWAQVAKLTASDAAVNDFFGNSVSLSGDRAIVGAFQDDDRIRQEFLAVIGRPGG